MVATVMRISNDLKNFITTTQQKLKKEIYEHHALYNKLKQDPKNIELEKKLKLVQSSIQGIGEEQQLAIHRIKLEVKEYGKKIQTNGLLHAVIGRATNLNNAIQSATNKVKKQNAASTSPAPSQLNKLLTTRGEVSTETGVVSDESSDMPGSQSPEPPNNVTNVEDLTQVQFMKYFGIVTHVVYTEMQKKRVERKRRSTANSQFFYGPRWDLPKRKRSAYLSSNISPPHTRQAAKKAKAERSVTPPSKDSSPRAVSPTPIDPKQLLIPKLPVGLTIERIDPNRSTPDAKLCIVCCLPGGCLSVCESCMNGFHVSCHNRPLIQQPRKCPKCIVDMEVRTVGSLNVPSGMSVSYVSATDITAKLHEKHKLVEENKSLSAELIKLQDQHSQLTISLKEQQLTREELLVNQHSTEDKIKSLLGFIGRMKSPLVGAAQ